MDVNNMDYTRYSTKELLEAKVSISREVAPENHKNLHKELALRKNELTEIVAEEKRSTFDKLKILGYFQLTAATVLSLVFIQTIFTGTNLPGIVLLVAGIALNLAAGWWAVKSTLMGYRLSLLNQCLQSIVLVTGSFAYNYSGIGGIYIGFGDEIQVAARISPGLNIMWGNVNASNYYAIDGPALYFALVLLTGIDYKVQDREGEKSC